MSLKNIIKLVTVKFNQFVICVFLCMINLLISNANILENIDKENPLLTTETWYIIDAIVIDIEEKEYTNQNPPTGILKVNNVLRGHKIKDTLKTKWNPEDYPKHHIGCDDPNYYPDDWHERPFKKEWLNKPFEAPKLGDRVIVIGLPGAGGKNISVIKTYKYSEENKKIISKHATWAGWSDEIVKYLFITQILLLPLAILIFLLSAFFKQRRKMTYIGVLILNILLFIVYAIYELGVPPAINIRVDLIFLYPLLSMNFILMLITGFLLFKKQSTFPV